MKHQRNLISIALATIMLVSLCAVCASTNVSAASPPGQPIAAGTGPSVCLLKTASYPAPTDHYFVFVKGYDGVLWYRVMDLATGWWTDGWTSLGGKLSSSPCAVSRSPGYLDVYVAGTGGAIYERPYANGVWHDWTNVGGRVTPGTGPGASGWQGREDVFVEGTTGALYQKTWTTASAWSGWTNLGGKLTWSPAAVSWDVGRIDVSVRGGGGVVWHKWYQNGWSSWQSLGGHLASGTGPAMSSWNTGGYRLDVFVAGTDGAMYQKTWTSASGWASWVNLGGSLTSSPTALSWNPYIVIYIRGSDGNVWQREWFSQVWHPWAHGMQGPPCQDNCG